jgi:hypothetical protein
VSTTWPMFGSGLLVSGDGSGLRTFISTQGLPPPDFHLLLAHARSA